MKRVLLILMIGMMSLTSAQTLKPYVMGAESPQALSVVKVATQSAIELANFTILGEYMPAGDESRWVYIINTPGMIKAIQATGGLTAFAAALRVGLTEESGVTKISYTDPEYLGNAYFQKSYQDVAHHFVDAKNQLMALMDSLGTIVNQPFGMEKGLTPKEVGKYHYMFGMEYFEDVVELTEFSSYEVGKSIIRSKLSKGGDTNLVYSIEIPGQKATLYGIDLGGDTGESHFLPIIDIGTPKHTAFLPYEILLTGNKAVMMHGRYRIALAFPDLTMTTFSKIMSTPGDIEELMRSVTE